MALQKQTITLDFSRGLNSKVDPFQLALGNFLVLQNQVFTKEKQLTKRNGFGYLPQLPDSSSTFLTTFKKNLTAIGSSFQALAQGSQTWKNKGSFTPLSLSTLPLVRSNLNQSQADTAVSSNNLVCTAYTESDGTNTSYKFSVADSQTGQNVVAPQVITPSSGTVTGSPRVFLLGNYFVIVFTVTISAANHLQYIAINTRTLTVTLAADISSTYAAASTVAFDGVVANNNLYLAWNASSSGGIKMSYLDSTLTQHTTTNPDSSHQATLVSVCADTTQATAVIWVSYYNSATSTGYSFAVNQQLTVVLSATQIISSGTLLNLTSAAQNSVNTVFYEVSNTYTYDPTIATNYIQKNTLTQAGTLGTASTLARSVGLASKAFIYNSSIYLSTVYSSPYQPTYFVLNSSGQPVAKLAYSNGGGYLTKGLPSAQLSGSSVQFPYLYKDLIAAVNKNTNVASGTQTAGVYSQTGVNLAKVTFGTSQLSTVEAGNNLLLNGGFLWMYDGYAPVEQNFFLWPDSVEVFTSTSGGALSAQQYFYQATYEWTDSQGNAFRSAPSIPVSVTTTGSSSSNTIYVPSLRLSYKTNVKIVIYRWSTTNQVYYQVTSISAPTLNNPGADYISFVDTLSDASILGNNILYTTGGVVEDVGAPAFTAMTLFNSRLFGIDAEDGSLLWFSKQVIQGTPVEMSDLLTYYVNPSQGAPGPTGDVKCLAPMDDKLILFKSGSLEYITGQGPNNTGNDTDFPLSPTFITATVGSKNQNSIVFIPLGLMFQSAQGIWLLRRDLTTSYVGAPVEDYTNGATVLSAVTIPGTTQVRFTLDSAITLMYDYYFEQWGVFTGISGISSTLYQGLHTFIDKTGAAYQETPGVYLDGTNPVNRTFTTSWIAVGGIQGYQRAYWLFLLGQYLSPHKLTIGIAYDFNPVIQQQIVISPDNYSAAFGGSTTFGADASFGGVSQVEQWQINFKQQTCESFQITVTESYDSTLGVSAGAGFTLSGLSLVVGLKKTYPRSLPATRKVG